MRFGKKLRLYWNYATRSLARGGQRTVLAIFCVAVGVLAIVALQLVAQSVNLALLSNIIEANGGDLRLRTFDNFPLTNKDLPYLEQLQQTGQITAYATTWSIDGDIILPNGGDVTLTVNSVSANYPLISQPAFIAPTGAQRMQDVLRGNTVAVSDDVFNQLHAHIGDSFNVHTHDGRLVPITIGAEYKEAGAFFAGELFINQSALQAIPGPNGKPLPPAYTSVAMLVPSANLKSVAVALQKQFPLSRVISAEDLLAQRQKQVDLIRLFLHLVGLLALFIGGVGIINTMQVLLRRRRVEIAMLKTSGYQVSDLYGLFGLEAALLGLMGGALGTAAGVGASYLVRYVVDQAFYLHLPVILDLLTIASGVVIGVATALIFGLLPIVQSSQVRPLAVLRESEEGARTTSRAAYVGLLVLLSLLFIGLAATILGSLLYAVLAVYGGLIAVGALGLSFGLLVWGIARLPVYERPRWRMLLWVAGAAGVALGGLLGFGLLAGIGAVATRNFGVVGIAVLVLLGGMGIILASCALIFLVATLVDALVMFTPRAWKTVVMLAYRNIGRQRVRTTTTLTALFVGVFGIGMVLVMGQGIRDTIDSTILNALHYNVFVLTPPTAAQSVQQTLAAVPGANVQNADQSAFGRIRPQAIGGLSGPDLINKLRAADELDAFASIEGFDLRQGAPYTVVAAGQALGPADSGTNHAMMADYLRDAPFHLRVGDAVVVQSTDGKVSQSLQIIGFYDTSSPTGNPNFGSVLTDEGIAKSLLTGQELIIFSLKIQPAALPTLRSALNTAVPTAFIFSLVDITALVDHVLTSVIVMMTTIASLAMIAGLIIIANAVALAMLERRREIGILKSVGHTSGSVLATVLVENGLVGVLGALVAMLLVIGAIVALGGLVLHVSLIVSPQLVGLIIIVTALVTMTIAALVAWNAARVKPLEVLRYE